MGGWFGPGPSRRLDRGISANLEFLAAAASSHLAIQRGSSGDAYRAHLSHLDRGIWGESRLTWGAAGQSRSTSLGALGGIRRASRFRPISAPSRPSRAHRTSRGATTSPHHLSSTPTVFNTALSSPSYLIFNENSEEAKVGAMTVREPLLVLRIPKLNGQILPTAAALSSPPVLPPSSPISFHIPLGALRGRGS